MTETQTPETLAEMTSRHEAEKIALARGALETERWCQSRAAKRMGCALSTLQSIVSRDDRLTADLRANALPRGHRPSAS